MKLPHPSPTYNIRDQAEQRAATERAIRGAHKRGEDVEVGDSRLVMKSPNGNRWSITVSNAGVLGATAL
jgi:hypothetical protein